MELRQGTMQEAGINPGKMQLLEDYVLDYMKSGGTYAFQFLAARHGIIYYHKVFGKASYEPDAPLLSKDTIFPLSSVTKTITATAAMILYEEGKLDIFKPIQYYVPEFVGENKEKCLVWQLMTHTSGLEDKTIWDWYGKNKSSIKTPQPEKNQLPGTAEYLYPGYLAPLWKKPGEEMSYCSYGMTLMGNIIRRVSGQSYHSFVKEKILNPLGMEDSYIPVPKNVWSRIIRRPAVNGDDWYTNPRRLESADAASGLYSTAADMAIFCQMYLNKGTYNGVKILNPETVKDMTLNHTFGLRAHFFEEYFPEAGWGYCWDVPYGKTTSGHLVSKECFTHGGSGGAMILIDPGYDMFWVRLCVHMSAERMPINEKFADLVFKAVED